MRAAGCAEQVSQNRRLVRHYPMDDKSLNLWRQIEDCRRRNRKLPLDRRTATAPPPNKA
jgi:hypothetical protein